MNKDETYFVEQLYFIALIVKETKDTYTTYYTTKKGNIINAFEDKEYFCRVFTVPEWKEITKADVILTWKK